MQCNAVYFVSNVTVVNFVMFYMYRSRLSGLYLYKTKKKKIKYRKKDVETVNLSHTHARVAIDIVNYATKYTTKMKAKLS